MKKNYKEAIFECYRRLYKEATPSADFDKLYNEAEINDIGQRVINFQDYVLNMDRQDEIIKAVMSEFKIPKRHQSDFLFAIALGCSPKYD